MVFDEHATASILQRERNVPVHIVIHGSANVFNPIIYVSFVCSAGVCQQSDSDCLGFRIVRMAGLAPESYQSRVLIMQATVGVSAMSVL